MGEEQKKEQQKMQDFLGIIENNNNGGADEDIYDDNEDSSDDDDGDTSRDDFDQNDQGEEADEEDNQDGGEDDKADSSSTRGSEEDKTIAVLKSQNERYLAMLESIAKEKAASSRKDIPSIYESDKFKAMVDILDLDENEAKIFVGFMQDLQNDTQQRSVEQALKDTPEVVGKYVNRQSTLTEIKTKFFNDNPALKEVASYVGHIANTVHAENADWDVGSVLEEAAKRSYKALGIKKELVNVGEKAEKRNPAFAKGTKGSKSRTKAPVKNKLEQDMLAMLNLD